MEIKRKSNSVNVARFISFKTKLISAENNIAIIQSNLVQCWIDSVQCCKVNQLGYEMSSNAYRRQQF